MKDIYIYKVGIFKRDISFVARKGTQQDKHGSCIGGVLHFKAGRWAVQIASQSLGSPSTWVPIQ